MMQINQTPKRFINMLAFYGGDISCFSNNCTELFFDSGVQGWNGLKNFFFALWKRTHIMRGVSALMETSNWLRFGTVIDIKLSNPYHTALPRLQTTSPHHNESFMTVTQCPPVSLLIISPARTCIG